MTPRTIFIWDVHGCIDELRELMDKLTPTREDRVIFLGDLIDKWPDSAWVVEYVYTRGYECILGNHELAYQQHYTHHPVHQAYRASISDAAHAWLLSLPIYIEEDGFIAVHAGFAPDQCLTDREIICEIRTWNTEKWRIGTTKHPAWHTFYTGEKKVFYGHWAMQRLMIKENTIGLDSGCVYGDQLSAYILESSELVQVQARGAYVKPGEVI